MATQYRDTRAGSALVDALDELVTEGRLPGDLAVKVLEEVRLKRGERKGKGTHSSALAPRCGRPLSPSRPPPRPHFFSLALSFSQFDAVFLNALTTKVTGRATFKARLDTYRFCDNVWTFVISGAEFRVAGGGGGGAGGENGGGGGAAAASAKGAATLLPTPGRIKLVCVDSKVVDGPDGGGGGGGGGGAGGPAV